MTRKMDSPILLISPLPPPCGGIATWTEKMLKYGLGDERITLVDTRIRGKRNIFSQASVSLSEMRRTISILLTLIYQLIAERPKLVHLSCSLSSVGIFRDLMCAVLVKLFRIPLISHYRGNVPDFCHKRFYGLSGLCLKRLIHHANVNIVENQPSLKKIQALAHVNAVLLPNFIEDTVFDYTVLVPPAQNRLQALFAGGITRAKGINEILQLARQLPNVDFHLFGVMHDDMVAAFKRPPANIIVHGIATHAVLLDAMCVSDFLLFPTYTEGFPMTVLEAMAVGLPVIASNVGAIPEMVDEGKGGFLVPPRDVKALLGAIKTLISTPDLKQAMGRYNKEKCVKEYRYSAVTDKLQTIYHQLLSEAACVE